MTVMSSWDKGDDMQDHTELKKLKDAYIRKNVELTKELTFYHGYAEDMAQAERKYLVAKSSAILDLKDKGQSVTLIPAIAKGMVADERFKFKVAESLFHACREKIKALHANLDSYRSLLSTAKAEMEIR